MPAEYVAIRNSIRERCERGMHPGKRDDEDCLQYAKRLASIIYYKRAGKTPREAESDIELLEAVEELLGRLRNEQS